MFPGHSTAFQAYIEPARERSEIWRTLVGILLVLLIFALLTATILGGGFLIAENIRIGLGYKYLIEMRAGRAISATLLNLGAISLFIPALWIVLRYLHKRPLLSLIGPENKIDWNLWRSALYIFLVLGIISFFASYLSIETVQQMPFTQWIKWLGPVLILLFLQTSAEEMFFRGYLQQQLAARFKSRLIWWLLPALAFGSMHYNPTIFGNNAWLVVLTTTLMGLILADITARFGNLSASMGLHFANNVFVMLFLNTPGQMSGASLFLHEMNLKSDKAAVEMMISLVFILVGYSVFLAIMRTKRM